MGSEGTDWRGTAGMEVARARGTGVAVGRNPRREWWWGCVTIGTCDDGGNGGNWGGDGEGGNGATFHRNEWDVGKGRRGGL